MNATQLIGLLAACLPVLGMYWDLYRAQEIERMEATHDQD